MPVAGRKPKPEDQKVTRHALTQGWTEVEEKPYLDGPKMPKHPGGQPWPKWTRQWWATVVKMPHCVLWTEDDWLLAQETLLVHAAYVAGDLRQAKELRDREARLGMTFDARRDLRIKYVPVVEESRDDVPPDVADFEAERRRRLMEGD